MEKSMLGKGFAATLLISAWILPFTVQADSPDNLDIIWARTKGEKGATADKAPIYSQKSTRSKVVKHYANKYVVILTGRESDGYGQEWYEVAWPFKGWLRASDTWFAPQLGGYYPEKLPEPERLSLRMQIDIGNYPAATIKVLGKPKNQQYRVEKGLGNLVVQTLWWKGTVIEYQNSYRQAELAWIDSITLSKGAKAGFGPIHIGDRVEKLGIFGIEKPQLPSGEVTMGTNIYRYRFTYKDGKIDSMSYRFGVNGDFLPAQ